MGLYVIQIKIFNFDINLKVKKVKKENICNFEPLTSLFEPDRYLSWVVSKTSKNGGNLPSHKPKMTLSVISEKSIISFRISATVFPMKHFSESPNSCEATCTKGPDGNLLDFKLFYSHTKWIIYNKDYI